MAAAIDTEFSSLLATLYAGIDAAQPWQQFLEALTRWSDSSHATLIITAPGKSQPATFLTPGGNPSFNDNYTQFLFADDPFHGFADGEVTSYAEFMAGLPDDAFPEYRRVMHESGFDHVLGLDLYFGKASAPRTRADDARYEARFRLSRHNSLPDYSRDDRARFQALAPHLRIAVRLFERLQFAGAQHGVFHATTQQLGVALLVLDRNRRIVSSNDLAEALLSEAEGLRRRDEELIFDHPAHARLVTGLLADAAPARLARFRIERPGSGDLVVTGRPLDLHAIHAGAGALALFLVRPGPESHADPQTLRALLGLTTAESRLAAVLVEGLGLVDAARRLGIAHNTAKVQLRSIFAKTGVNRQAQLITLLGTLRG